ncbi:MAG: hypothetical protein ABI026_02475 [Gemmatimonadaceae bacterium]
MSIIPPDLITLFVAPLNRLDVTYMVTGSVASGTYSHIRFTNDVDLVAVLSDVDAERLHAAFDTPAFYVPPLDVINVERMRIAHGHINLIHVDTGLKADIFFSGDDRLMNEALRMRKRVTDQHGETVWFAPPEYVILSKLRYLRDSGSAKHITDIRAMLRVRGDSLDTQLLLAEVEAMGLQAVWEQVRE